MSGDLIRLVTASLIREEVDGKVKTYSNYLWSHCVSFFCV